MAFRVVEDDDPKMTYSLVEIVDNYEVEAWELDAISRLDIGGKFLTEANDLQLTFLRVADEDFEVEEVVEVELDDEDDEGEKD